MRSQDLGYRRAVFPEQPAQIETNNLIIDKISESFSFCSRREGRCLWRVRMAGGVAVDFKRWL